MNDLPVVEPQKSPALRAVIVSILIVLLAPRFSGAEALAGNLFLLALCAAAAAWLMETSGWLAGLLSPVPVYLFSWLTGGSPLNAIGSLLYFPCGVFFFLVSRRRINRTAAVALSSAILSVGVLSTLLLGIYHEAGSLSPEAVAERYRNSDLMVSLRSTFVTEVAGQEVSLVSDETLAEYVRLLFGILPGVVAMLSAVLSFLCGWLYRTLLRITKRPLPDPENWRLSPAPVSAFLLLAALIVSAAVEKADLPYFAAADLFLILAPFFFFAGVSTIFEVRIIDGLPRPRLLRPLLFLIATVLSLFQTGGLVYLLILPVCFGVFDSLRSLIPKKEV